MFSWHAIPFARLLIPFTAGIFTALYLPFGFVVPLILTVLCTTGLLLINRVGLEQAYKTRLLKGLLFTFLFALLGYSRTYWFDESKSPEYFGRIKAPAFLCVTVDDAVVEKEKYFKCYARVDGVINKNDSLINSGGTILLYLRKNSGIVRPRVGDRYLARASYQPIPGPANPGEFNYRQYLSYHNIHYQLFADSSGIIKEQTYKPSLYRNASVLKDRALAIITKYIPSERERGVAEALLLGFKDHLDPDITAAFSRTGTLHVLAVSGLHAALIFFILAFITAPLLKFKRGPWIQAAIVLGGIWLYAYVTGLSSSVLRASLMFSVISVGKLLSYRVNIYNNIYASAFILLLLNPLYIVDVGFQLSYLAVLGIVFIQPMINKWYTPRYKLDAYIWSLVSVSFAAQLLTFPIGIFYFHQFPNYFLLSNLLIIPITSVILFLLVLLLAVAFWSPVAVIVGKVLALLLYWNNTLVEAIDRLPYAVINGLYFDMQEMLLAYAIFFFFIGYCIHRRAYLLNTATALALIFVTYGTAGAYHKNRQRIMTVHHIKGHDVFTFIDGRHAYIAADTGFINHPARIKFFLEPFFWEKGVRVIDKFSLDSSFSSGPVFYKANCGLQFFDKFLTISNGFEKGSFKADIIYVKKISGKNIADWSACGKIIKLAPSITSKRKIKIEEIYFKQFNKRLNNNDNFIQILF